MIALLLLLDLHAHPDPLRSAPLRRRRQRRGRPPRRHQRDSGSRSSAFVICSSMAAIAGLLSASYTGKVSPGSGGGNELLYAVGAAVIGGTSLFGGRGRAMDAVIGGLVIATIPNGLGPAQPGQLHQLPGHRRRPAARRERGRDLASPSLRGRRLGRAHEPHSAARASAPTRRPSGATTSAPCCGTSTAPGRCSRAELTSVMGLNRSTIAGLVGELESLGISERATPVGGARQGAGRPSAGVRIAADGPVRHRGRPGRRPGGRGAGRARRHGAAAGAGARSRARRGLAGRRLGGRPDPHRSCEERRPPRPWSASASASPAWSGAATA